MKNIITVFILLLASAVCDAKTTITEINGDFSAIRTTGNVSVHYSKGDRPSIKIVAPQEMQDLFEWHFEGGSKEKTLVIGGSPTRRTQGRLSVVYVEGPSLGKYESSSNSMLYIDGDMISESRNTRITADDNSEIKVLDFSGNNVVILSKSNATVSASIVKCRTLEAVASGNAALKLRKVESESVTAKGQSNAEAKLYDISAVYVSATASGNSEVRLSGKVDNVEFMSSGNSEIKAGDLDAKEGTASASGLSEIRCCVLKLTSNTSSMAEVTNYKAR